MRPGDIDRVVGVHLERFPNHRSTRLGPAFLHRMYEWFLFHMPELALVAEINGQVEGFILGSVGGYGRRVFAFAFKEIVSGLLSKPELLLDGRTYQLWHSYIRGLLPARTSSKGIAHAAGARGKVVSFASVAVSSRYPGLGTYLIQALEVKARNIGADRLSTSIENHNVNLIRLYRRLGWEIRHQGDLSTSLLKHLRQPSAECSPHPRSLV